MKKDYENILVSAFPESLKLDVLNVFSIIPLESKYSFDLIHTDSYIVNVGDETLKIPTRIYFNEPRLQDEEQLAEREKDILNGIYTRHHNGYIREKRLHRISESLDHWKIPYLVQLLGEYVFEMLLIIDKKVNEMTLNFYIEFKDKNPKYWQQTESRMISYWNEYYRYKFPKLNEYLGFKIVNRIKTTPIK